MAEDRTRIKGKLTSHNLAVQRALNEAEVLCANPLFRRFLFRFLTQSGMYRSSYSPGSPHDTSFNEGRRSLGLETLSALQRVKPDILAIMEAEGLQLTVEEQLSSPTVETDNEPPDPDEP